MLQDGIYIDNISYPNIKAEKLYIKWNKKINLTIKNLEIHKQKNNKKVNLKLDEIDGLLKKSVIFDIVFEKVLIENITYNNIKGSFKYKDGAKGFLNLSSPDFKLNTSLFFEQNLFNIKINSFIDKKKKIKINGNLIFNNYNTLELTSAIYFEFNNDIKLDIYANSTIKKLIYSINARENIKDLKILMDTFAPTWEARYWVRDAIDMSSLTLKKVHGFVEYDKSAVAYKNLYATATVNDLNYIYDVKLDPIHTTHTELMFKDGKLNIKPKNAYTYNTYLNTSWLIIDFTTSDPYINLFLNFTGQLNKDLLYLLSHFGIDIPFIQTKGTLKTDLRLDINLFTVDIEAHGDFYTNNSWINYLGLDINVFDTHVVLDNTKAEVKNMFAKYNDMLTSHLDIYYDAKNSNGKLDFRVDSAKVNNIELNTQAPLHVEYIISTKQDYVKIDKSKWKFGKQKIDIEKVKIPFNIKTLSARIPETKVSSDKTISSLVSGTILFKPIIVNLDISILDLNYLNTTLNQENFDFNFDFNKSININSTQHLSLKTSKDIYNIDNLNINIINKQVKAKGINLSVSDFLKSNIDIEYNLNKKNGFIDINNINISNETFSEIFNNSISNRLNIQNNDNITITSKDYGIKYILNDYEWKVNIDSISKISKHSSILQKYYIDNGKLEINKKYNEKNIKFTFNTDYKYKLLVKDNKPLKKYLINGKIYKNNDVDIRVNNSVNVKIKDDIQIFAKNIGLNINEIIKFLSSIEEDKKKKSPKINFIAKDSFIFLSEDRRILADSINLNYFNNILNAELMHNKGKANLEYINNNIHLKGDNFNYIFMNNLFALSKFDKGSLGFNINGPAKSYSGLIYIKNTIMYDYKLLNNILAFINTIPSLTTFSLPGYTTQGLSIKNSHIDFSLDNDIYNINDFSLISKEVSFSGKGNASIVNNDINMDLVLRTNLGSSISKIPLVGYILLGKDNISTSFHLNGKLDNPKVKTQVFKDIMSAPLNILERTFNYSIDLIKMDLKK